MPTIMVNAYIVKPCIVYISYCDREQMAMKDLFLSMVH